MAIFPSDNDKDNKEKDLVFTCTLCKVEYYYNSQDIEKLILENNQGYITCPHFHLLSFPERIKDNEKKKEN